MRREPEGGSFRLTIEYEGTRYSGWQAQTNTPKTVQGRLQNAAAQLFERVELGGAGRTDAGVHAAGQVAHLRTNGRMNPDELARKLNDLLPHDIHVLRASPAPRGFHARHDAVSRVYLYQISTRRAAFAKPFVWWIKDRLDVAAMSQAAERVTGRHDFAAFCDRRNTAESTVVVVDSMQIARSGDLILVRIAASHFLWKMVRKIVAALVEIGRRELDVETFQSLIENPEDQTFLPTAAPSGLFLEAVLYQGETFDRPLKPIVPVETFVPELVPAKETRGRR
ncbi:MAG TPA: tRNA pseudouridine(38-40) synthase TruA [Thermoanaerobaculia bacterium]|nr:tRNA pseudouridine(38-40) synthase TruA [Thermoanaerobaculia bacterium]